MKIKNIGNRSGDQLRQEVAQGGKFVLYKYCISIVVMTFNRPSSIHYIPPGKSAVGPGLGHLLTNLTLGWWGIPWGPIYTLGNIGSILSGGKDVTSEVMSHINQNDPTYGNHASYAIPGQGAPASGAGAYNIPRN